MSDEIEVEVEFRRDGVASIMVRPIGEDRVVFLPKSEVSTEADLLRTTPGEAIKVTGPEWLFQNEGMI